MSKNTKMVNCLICSEEDKEIKNFDLNDITTLCTYIRRVIDLLISDEIKLIKEDETRYKLELNNNNTSDEVERRKKLFRLIIDDPNIEPYIYLSDNFMMTDRYIIHYSNQTYNTTYNLSIMENLFKNYKVSINNISDKYHIDIEKLKYSILYDCGIPELYNNQIPIKTIDEKTNDDENFLVSLLH
jgi:hypothetical protein